MENHFWNEVWIELHIEGFNPKTDYQISNYGRIKSFAYDKENGKIKKHYLIKGYPTVTFKVHNGPTFTKYIHKLVAEHFIPKENDRQLYVIHMDYNKLNNYVENLRWASKKEKERHQFSGPNFKPIKGKRKYSKLTETDGDSIEENHQQSSTKDSLKNHRQNNLASAKCNYTASNVVKTGPV